MAQGDTVDHISGKQGHPLPPDLSVDLTPPVRHALNHHLRREILRTLHRSEDPRSPAEIAAALPTETSVSLISYHAHVLENCGILSVADVQPTGETLARHYTSKLAGDTLIVSILQATEPLDRPSN
jgi:DNA-binding transcriptional ArsR family regulator